MLPDSLDHFTIDQLQATADRKAAQALRSRTYADECPDGDPRRDQAYEAARLAMRDKERCDQAICDRWEADQS